MTFGFTESEQAVKDLSERLFRDGSPPERLNAVEATATRIDEKLWALCASSGLLGLCLPGDVGGEGLGLPDLVVMLEQQGRFVAPVPLAPTIVSALAVAEFGSQGVRKDILPAVADGSVMLASALPGAPAGLAVGATARDGGWALSGREIGIPAVTAAGWLLVPARVSDAETGLFLVSTAEPDLDIQPAATTNRQACGHISLDGAPAQRLGDDTAVEWLRQRMTIALCAIQCGVTRTAVELTARYVSERKQFGKPLSYFQAVLMRLADAFIGTEMLQTATYAAAVGFASGHDSAGQVAVAKWWASDRGPRVVEAALHLHGGAGNVLDYPLARCYLWAKQIDIELGGAASQLALLGDWLAQQRQPIGGHGDR